MYNLKVNSKLYNKYNIIAIKEKKFSIKVSKYITKFYIILNATSFDIHKYNNDKLGVLTYVTIGVTRFTPSHLIKHSFIKHFDYNRCNFYCIQA